MILTCFIIFLVFYIILIEVIKHLNKMNKKLMNEIKDSISKLRFRLESLERDCQFYHSSLEYICEEIEDKCDDIIESQKEYKSTENK